MLKVRKEGVILSPTSRAFEKRAVLNPGILQVGDTVHVIYRAVAKDHMSTLGYARLNGPLEVVERMTEPLYTPKTKAEKKGLEDPRLTIIDGTIYLTYVAHDGKHALIAYMSGADIFHLKRGGVISAKIRYARAGKFFNNLKLKDDYFFFEAYYKNFSGKDVMVWEKDGVLFPEKINGKFIMTHRVLPDIQITEFRHFDELKKNSFWLDYFRNMHKHVILENKYAFEERHIGGGAPPIKTKAGWLLIYHGTEENNQGRTYHACAALFDLEDPHKLIARLPEPLISPTEDYELSGYVDNVVFPTGTAVFNKRLYIYYGAADCHIAVASVELEDLLSELKRHKIKS
jgi:predicted GH43/DUF377 family glycosyl hydrolase